MSEEGTCCKCKASACLIVDQKRRHWICYTSNPICVCRFVYPPFPVRLNTSFAQALNVSRRRTCFSMPLRIFVTIFSYLPTHLLADLTIQWRFLTKSHSRVACSSNGVENGVPSAPLLMLLTVSASFSLFWCWPLDPVELPKGSCPSFIIFCYVRRW